MPRLFRRPVATYIHATVITRTVQRAIFYTPISRIYYVKNPAPATNPAESVSVEFIRIFRQKLHPRGGGGEGVVGFEILKMPFTRPRCNAKFIRNIFYFFLFFASFKPLCCRDGTCRRSCAPSARSYTCCPSRLACSR